MLGSGSIQIIGDNGANGNDGTSSSINGSDGENGTNALKCTSYSVLSGNVTIKGGDGGNGGRGGSGYDGIDNDSSNWQGGSGASGGSCGSGGGSTDGNRGKNGSNGSTGYSGNDGTEPSCVAEGTLITLADGRQVPVETLTGNEQLLVWNIFTGQFESAPILFIDKDSSMEYEVINLKFSDGTIVKVISEHGFWDFDLNEYIFLRSDAAKYIGHWFNKQKTDADGNLAYTRVQLTGITVQKEVTTAWSPVTYGHLCYYVNGMLSMPGATTGLINIFNVDPDTMKINEEAYNEDIEKYGLFTYEEFLQVVDVPKEMFEAFNGQYLKVAIGKGLLTQEHIKALVEHYAKFF